MEAEVPVETATPAANDEPADELLGVREAIERHKPRQTSRKKTSRPGVELALTTILSSLGAASGYYLATIQQAGITEWSAGGAAVGAAVGWIMIRWIVRRAR